MTEWPECAATQELIGELAAGIAAGDERARALSHLAGCPDCQGQLAATAGVVDELLLLAPEREPPAGLESAVLAALAPPARRRWRTPLLWAASVVVTAVLAGGVPWWQTADDRELAANYRQTLAVARGTDLRAAALTREDGAESGAVFAYQGSPSWIYVTFRRPPAPGAYTVRLRTEDGRQLALRPFTARRNAPAWGSTIDLPIRAIRSIEFVRAGVPVLSALFSP
jgi:Putative zinc-finger